MRKWRNKPTRYFATRPIFKDEYPLLVEAMMEDGLTAIITHEGIVWMYGDYQVQKKIVMEVWGLSKGQMKRVYKYIYSHDPFVERT